MQKYRYKSIARGTVSNNEGIFHFNPDGRDKKARRGIAPESIIELAKKKGLIEVGSSVTEGNARSAWRSGPSVAETAAERREDRTEDSPEEIRQYFGSGASTRDTTLFERHPHEDSDLNTERHDLEGDDDDDLDPDADEDGDDDDAEDEDESEDDDETEAVIERIQGEGERGNAGGSDAPPRDDEGERQEGQGTGTAPPPPPPPPPAPAAKPATGKAATGKAPAGRKAATPPVPKG